MATLPKNPGELDNIFTDPDTAAASLFYKVINGVTVNWAGVLPTDADNGQVYYEYGPFPNGLKIRFYQFGAVYPARYDFSGCTEKLAVNEQKLIGTIPVVVSDGTNDTASSVQIWMDGKTAFVPTVPPGAMAAPTVATVSSTAVSADMAAPPTPGDGPILGYKLRYSTDGGTNWTIIVDPFDPHTISGLPANTIIRVQSLAYNIVGDGPWSPTGMATTDPGSGAVLNQTMFFGAKTLAGKGGGRPFNNLGVAVDLASYDSLVSGSLGAYVPSVSGGALLFTGGGAGAPNGAVLRCTLAAGGTVDLTITTVANAYHANTLADAKTAFQAAVLGDTVYWRDGIYNPTAARQTFMRGTVPAGTWTGSNYVVLTSEVGGKAIIGSIEVGGNGSNIAQHAKWSNLTFRAPTTATTNDGRHAATSMNAIFHVASATNWIAIENCWVGSDVTVTPLTVGVYHGIKNVGSQNFLCRGNTIDGTAYGITNSKADGLIEDNIVLRTQVDSFVISGARTIVRRNTATERAQQAVETPVLAVATGATTTITVANTDDYTVNEVAYLINMGGMTLAQGINAVIQSKTATTVTLILNTTGQTYTGGGTIGTTRGLHGDYLQMPNSMPFDGDQDDIKIIGNRFYSGAIVRYLYCGQVFAGSSVGSGGTPVAAIRRRLQFIGNFISCTVVHGPSLSNVVDGLIASNTSLRQLGIPSGQGSVTTMTVTGTNNTVVDNVANAFNLPGASVNINNVTLPVTTPNALPSNATDVATYEAAFVDPETVGRLPLTYAELVAAYAPKAGGPLDLAIVPGCIGGAYNQATGIYTNPR